VVGAAGGLVVDRSIFSLARKDTIDGAEIFVESAGADPILVALRLDGPEIFVASGFIKLALRKKNDATGSLFTVLNGVGPPPS
jgi:hypothetical protein